VEVEGKKPTQRVMTAINYLEEGEATLEEFKRYGYAAVWPSHWPNRLERLADEPFEEVIYKITVPGDPLSSLTNSTISSLRHSTNHPKNLD
jgi:hypothetical protein